MSLSHTIQGGPKTMNDTHRTVACAAGDTTLKQRLDRRLVPVSFFHNELRMRIICSIQTYSNIRIRTTSYVTYRCSIRCYGMFSSQ